jgi:hypothetical protein
MLGAAGGAVVGQILAITISGFGKVTTGGLVPPLSDAQSIAPGVGVQS